MERLSRYLRATVAEMKHVRWPTRQQALIYTALVIGISVVVAIFVSAADYVFTSMIDFIVNTI